jgi:hypothetical protein
LESLTTHVFDPFSISTVITFKQMITFIAWILLFILCWPLAILALVLYPIVWLIMLPFRLLGIAVEGVFNLIKSIIMLPFKLIQRA